MPEMLTSWGYWTWWIIAGILLILELLLPGVFFLWLGIAAAGIGFLALLIVLPWQVEILLFGGFAVALILIAKPWVEKRNLEQSDRPNLNRRLYDYVGRDYVLEKPIENGRGRLRIDDTLWVVEGPDLPAGAWVRVTGIDGVKLIVEPASRA